MSRICLFKKFPDDGNTAHLRPPVRKPGFEGNTDAGCCGEPLRVQSQNLRFLYSCPWGPNKLGTPSDSGQGRSLTPNS